MVSGPLISPKLKTRKTILERMEYSSLFFTITMATSFVHLLKHLERLVTLSTCESFWGMNNRPTSWRKICKFINMVSIHYQFFNDVGQFPSDFCSTRFKMFVLQAALYISLPELGIAGAAGQPHEIKACIN